MTEKTRLRPDPAAVAVAAVDLCHISEINRMFEGDGSWRRQRNRPLILSQNGVAGVAILAHNLAIGADVLTVMTAEAAVEIEMPDVVGMGLPIQLHLGECRALVDGLQFVDGVADLEFLAVG